MVRFLTHKKSVNHKEHTARPNKCCMSGIELMMCSCTEYIIKSLNVQTNWLKSLTLTGNQINSL